MTEISPNNEMNMTAGEVLEAAGALIERELPETVMLGWISELDCRVQGEILRRDISKIAAVVSESDRLCVPRGYDRVYLLYVKAMAELYRGNAEAYAVASRAFKDAYAEYAKHCIRSRA